ncbi:S49 family peptidase [Limisalsivibrio acetivorans]|uniref:S49 family peptidase n=1 Tax=Limisalsivibrio acetivorans TaxID=1304888 RepID=UPI0003B485EA|nr:S49 family peptidase [Limisalsivibrio acetivorans]
MSRAITAIMATSWAIKQESLESMYKIADRRDITEALQTRSGEPVAESMTVEKRGNVGIVPIRGPIFRYANVLTDHCGATSLQRLAKNLQILADDESVDTIILEIDSPGGQVDGISEVARHIKSMRAAKKVVAYVGGSGCSAAYWIASSAEEIVISDTAELGSIGVVATYVKEDAANEVQIVSSMSPNKRPDLETDEGRKIAQANVDDLAEVFIATAAANRGLTSEEMVEAGNKGGLRVGKKAVDSKLADRLGTLESLIAEYKKETTEENMDIETLKKEHSETYAAAVADGVMRENKRVSAIIKKASLPGYESIVQEALTDPNTSLSDVLEKVVEKQRTENASALKDLKTESEAPIPGGDTSPGDEEKHRTKVSAVAAEVLSEMTGGIEK